MRSYFFFLLIISFSTTLSSQNNKLADHKYIIVKSSFDFLKQVDRYKTSSFTKFLFKKAGYKVYLDNEDIPIELVLNKCNALYVNVKDKSGMLVSKNYIQITNCLGKLVFSSKKGTSKIKDYERAYRESIREAFMSIDNLDSLYDNALSEARVYKKESVLNKQVIKVNKIITPLPVTEEVGILLSQTNEQAPINQVKKEEYPLLYAQEIDGTYQLINKKPSVIFMLLKTTDANKFIIKDENGVLVNKGDYWLAEYYKNGILIVEKYQIKF